MHKDKKADPFEITSFNETELEPMEIDEEVLESVFGGAARSGDLGCSCSCTCKAQR